MNLTTRCPHCGNPRQRHHHESPWCDECFRSLFERLDRLEAIAAAQSTPSSPANAPEVPQGQTGDSDGTERNRVTEQNSPEPLSDDALRWIVSDG
jgi:predicted  nucleic acid-binding Zn-ribbon protein